MKYISKRLFKKVKRRLTTWPSNSIPRYLHKRSANMLHTKTRTQIVMAAWFTIAKKWQSPRCPPASTWINQTGISLQWILLNRKERSTNTHYSVDEPQKHTKWKKKLDKKSGILWFQYLKAFIWWNVQKRQIFQDRKKMRGCLGLEIGTQSEWKTLWRFFLGGWKCSNIRCWHWSYNSANTP